MLKAWVQPYVSIKYPIPTPVRIAPTAPTASMIPAAVADAYGPPKSMATVPAINEYGPYNVNPTRPKAIMSQTGSLPGIRLKK